MRPISFPTGEILELEDQLSVAEDEGNEPEIDRLETQIAEMDSLLNNFIRYHIQNSAIYMSSPASSGTYETSYMGGSRFATLTVNNNGQSGEGSITITLQRLAASGNRKRSTPQGVGRQLFGS